MSDLADAVLPPIRTRTDLWLWSAANAHGRRLHEASAACWPCTPSSQLGRSLLSDADAWDRVLKGYQKHDPIATLPVHTRLVEELLVDIGAQDYQQAARRLQTMRTLAAGTPHGRDVDALIAQLRATHRRRPRLLQEFDRAHLPR